MSVKRGLLVLEVVLVALCALSAAWPYDDDFSRWRLSRRGNQQCTGSGGKCFTTAHCCDGFVCAAFDDYFGENPEIPGFCVKEKDLKPCIGSVDCPRNSKCIALGHSGENYCLTRPGSSHLAQVSAKGMGRGRYGNNKALVGLGGSCEDTSDCKPFESGGDALCCQKVRRGKMSTKIMCDRKTPISKCLGQ